MEIEPSDIQASFSGSKNDRKQKPEELERSLSNRHIQLISIGGAIGTGLFMGSGQVLNVSGTSIILTYIIIGFFFFFIMRAMGEILLSNTNFKSFADFARAYLGPWAGYSVAWSYWLNWVVTAIADIIVIGAYMQFWYPDLPSWIPALFTALILTILNLFTVKAFGEMESWFALIKILAIIIFLVIGIYLIYIGYVSPNGVKASTSHLLESGTVFPHGIMGFFSGFQMAVFAFSGIELVGTTAAETKDPHRNIPRAINSIPFRIIFFYVSTLICIIMVVSWAKIAPDQSPFIHLFTLIGLPAAAGLVNFVAATSALSSANSGIFATSRMLYGLAYEHNAPEAFGKLSRFKVPANSLLFSMLCVVLGTTVLFVVPNVMTAFLIFSTLCSIMVIFTFMMILISYIAYRKKNPELHSNSKFKMPGGLFMCWLSLIFLIFTIVILALDHTTLIALSLTPLWFIALYFGYRKIKRKQHLNKALPLSIN
ncbi:amino acid permease [Acinetobacter baumannii]|nr:amino acid permease [Acinetobacter baumannii]